MGRKGYKWQKRSDGRFARLPFAILNSDAWKACNSSTRDVYTGMLLRFNGSNNGSIGYGCRVAADYANIGRNTAALAFKKLQEVGLIKCVTRSNFDCRKKLATEWGLTHLPIDGVPATGEWRNYKLQASPKRKRNSPISSTNYLKQVI